MGSSFSGEKFSPKEGYLNELVGETATCLVAAFDGLDERAPWIERRHGTLWTIRASGRFELSDVEAMHERTCGAGGP